MVVTVNIQSRFHNLAPIDTPIVLSPNLLLRPPREDDFASDFVMFGRQLSTGREYPLPFFGHSVDQNSPILDGVLEVDEFDGTQFGDAPWNSLLEALNWSLLIEGEAYVRWDSLRYRVIGLNHDDMVRELLQSIVHPHPQVIGDPFIITPRIAAVLPQTLSRFWPTQTASPALMVATRRLASAVWAGEADGDMLLDCCIGLEALYLPPGESERVEAMLCNTLAYYLGDNEGDREKMRKDVKEIYRLRSYIAHGQRGEASNMSVGAHQSRQAAIPKNAREALGLLRRSLRLMIREPLPEVGA